MGAYSPAPVVTPALHARIMREVIEPDHPRAGRRWHALHRLPVRGTHDRPDGTPKVLEFNCRFGDPETQPILMRLHSDLTVLCEAALAGRLDTVSAEWDRTRRARRGAGRGRLPG